VLREPRARGLRLTLEELHRGTFTITNGGVFGSLLSTPILNMPQSAILGMHKIRSAPSWCGGQIWSGDDVLALTYDHRLIDGREAVQFSSRSRMRSRIQRGACCNLTNRGMGQGIGDSRNDD